MHIVCPHCTTSYAINLATLGAAGRTVRCSRCKEVWLARPEDAIEVAAAEPAMAEAGQSAGNADAAAEWEALARQEEAQKEGQDTPVVDSPSISADWPDDASRDEANWPSVAREDAESHAGTTSRRRGLLRRLLPPFPRPHLHLPAATLPTGRAYS